MINSRKKDIDEVIGSCEKYCSLLVKVAVY